MKVDKLTKLENDIFRMEDVISESQKRLEALQQRYTQERNARIIEIVTKEGLSVNDVRNILTDYNRRKNAKEDLNEIEYVQMEENQ